MNFQITNNFIKNTDVLFTNSYRDNTFYKLTEINNNILDIIDEFIFIIDLPHQVGGVRFFLDTIISHYKKQSIFIVAKNINKKLNLIINNEYKLEYNYSLDESLIFIERYKNKINKIFFNHIYDHDKIFIEKLFTLDKHTTFITHDYYLLNNKTHLYYYELPKNQTHYLKLNKFDKIITQNDVNINIFKNYCNKKIDTIELPDFKKSKTKIKTNNDNIVVGIIGAISIEKGKEILENIVNFYKDTNIKIIVFGYVEIPNFNNHFKYNNINELNNLLTEHKPNILLELSLWPETYSYTLTLSMLTQLPILCLKKKFPSVIQNRLSKYEKVYYFTNYKNLSELINKHKQDFFYTIDDNIYFDNLWNEYFCIQKNINKNSYFKNIEGNNIVFITSKIIVSENKFSYVKKRSCYSKEERMIQTINTINSVRKFIPDAYIILIDNSIFNYFEYYILNNLVETFINITNNLEMNYFTDVFEYKAFGEISQTLQFLELFLKEDYLKINNFFKITGRYEINNEFNYQQYDNNLNIFKKHLSIKDKEYYFTCFYKLDKSILKDVQDIFIKFIQNKEKYMNSYSDLEVIYPNAIIDKIHLVDNLGIVENIGVWKKITNI